jgi:hypothetical protein
MSDPEIAVVIVTYKSAQLANSCLRSIADELTSSQLRIRVIVIDNASGDFIPIANAVRVNNWSSWVTVLEAPRNGGFAYGNNLGIKRAIEAHVPDYVYLLNPDTEVRPGAIRSLVDFLESYPSVGIAGSSFENQDGSEWPIAFRFPSMLSELDQGLAFGLATRLLRRWSVSQQMTDVAQPVDWISGASMMIRFSVIAAIGGLDENYFLYYEETDFCYRAKRAGFETWYVPKSRVMHIAGQSTNVTNRTGGPRRLPSYWFQSRRRFFAVTFGFAHAVAIDIVSVLAHSLGYLKQLVLRRPHDAVTHYIRDLIHHSLIWPRNRTIPPVKNYRPEG